MWYFNKNGCETDIEALCWNGPSLEEMFSQATGGGPVGGGFSEEEIEDVETRNEARQITPPEKRGIISRTQTSDPVGSGGGVGGPGYEKAALAHAYFVNNRISIA